MIGRTSDRLSAPVLCTLDIVDHCNLKCSYCYAHNFNKTTMQKEKVVGIIEEMRELGVWQITLGGGEPFMHPDLLWILEHSLESRSPLGIITNGTTMNARHFQRLRELDLERPGSFRLQVSIDGPDPETNDVLRGKGQRLFENIDLLLENGIPLCFGTVLHKHSVDHVEEIIRRFYPRVQNFHFMRTMPSHSVKALEESIDPDPEALRSAIGRLRAVRAELDGVRITFPDISEIIMGPETPKLSCAGCSAAVTRFDINARGEVLACNIADGAVMGSIYENSLREIWHSSEAERFRATSQPPCGIRI